MNAPHVQLRKLINQQKLDAALITNPFDIAYFTNFSNFSNQEREGYLLVTKRHAFIITDGRYDEAVKNQTNGFAVLTRTTSKSSYAIFSDIVKKYDISTVGFDENNLTVAEYVKLWDVFQKLIPLSIKSIRIKKDAEEIKKIQKACTLGDKAFLYIRTKLQTGVTEKAVAFLLEQYVKEKGAELSFPSIVAFGKNASVPHHQTGNTKLKKGDFVLLDFGVKFENYCSDMTRTIIFGEANERQKAMYDIVLASQKAAIDYMHANKTVKASDIDKVARDYIVAKGYPSIPHSLGHGIGLEVHEAPSLSPTSRETLEDGMVFSIEPGIYEPGFGGVRIEDLFTLQNGKLVQLTKSPNNLLQV
jgi:Xaa-Pro aminopeptidase